MSRVLDSASTILRHRGFVVMLGCSLLLGLAYSFVRPFMSMFGTIAVGMSPWTFGLFMTVSALGAIVASTVLARWSDTRCSRRAMLLLGCVTGVAGHVAFAYVRDVVWLTVIGTTLMGVSSITFSQLFAHARELIAESDIPPSDAPLYINVFRLFFALAWTVGPALAAWVMALYSYEGTFLAAAFVFLLLLIAVMRYIPSTPPRRAAAAVAAEPLSRSLARPDLLAHFVGFTFVFAASTMAMMNLPLLVLETLGGSQYDVGVIYGIAPIFELPLMFLLGWAATGGDFGRLIRGSVMLAVVYYGLLAMVGEPWHIYPLQILSAAITAVTQGVAITFFQNFLPDQVGTATNLYANAQRIGSTMGFLVFGALLAATGHRTIFVACAALCAAALILLWFFRPRASVRVA